MANLHSEFLEFFEKIKLSDAKKNQLNASKEAIRNDVKAFFKDKDDYMQPKFHTQGSMAMGLTINPLNEEYDIDDGIYIRKKQIDYDDIKTWPTTATVHQLVKEACDVKNRTVEDKTTCVRIVYANSYHVDLPIYIKDFEKNEFIPKLAHKEDGWIDSDPRANTEYYKNYKQQYGDILQRLIMYLKAIKDYQITSYGQPFDISGFELMLLCCKYISKTPINADNDGSTLLNICELILNNLKENTPLLKPITNEDLWNNRTEEDKNTIIAMFEYIKDVLEQAESEITKDLAKKVCTDLFGNRFHTKNQIQLFVFGSLTHRKSLQWSYSKKGNVRITSTYKVNGQTLCYNSTLLKKGISVWFTANVWNISGDYSIKWQVTNTGEEAKAKEALRGGFIESNHGKYIRTEKTEYRGSHIVQCFVIQNKICVAQSDEFYVNIK